MWQKTIAQLRLAVEESQWREVRRLVAALGRETSWWSARAFNRWRVLEQYTLHLPEFAVTAVLVDALADALTADAAELKRAIQPVGPKLDGNPAEHREAIHSMIYGAAGYPRPNGDPGQHVDPEPYEGD
jgi:hypothetical protein